MVADALALCLAKTSTTKSYGIKYAALSENAGIISNTRTIPVLINDKNEYDVSRNEFNTTVAPFIYMD